MQLKDFDWEESTESLPMNSLLCSNDDFLTALEDQEQEIDDQE